MNKEKNIEPLEQENEAETPETQETADVAEDTSIVLTMEQFSEIKARIEALQKEKEEAIDLMKHVQADFENFRKRNSAVRTESLEDGERETIAALLPVLDSLDSAIEAAKDDTSALADGLRMIQRLFLDTLCKMGLESIDAMEKPFDPMLHHAVMQEESEAESGTVIEVFQRGYQIKDKVLRYAMVKVAK